MNKVTIGLAATLFACASHASPYAVVAAGSSQIKIDCSGTDSCDDSGTGLKLLGGYKFTPNAAVELGYIDFGKGSFDVVGATAKFDVKAYTIGGAYHQDLSPDLSLVARLGLASVKAKGNAYFGGVNIFSANDSSTQAYVGLGLGYKLSEKLSLDGSFDFSKAELDGDKSDVRLLSVGLTYAF